MLFMGLCVIAQHFVTAITNYLFPKPPVQETIEESKAKFLLADQSLKKKQNASDNKREEARKWVKPAGPATENGKGLKNK